MSERSWRPDPIRAAFLPVSAVLALGVSVVFVHNFLDTKPFKLMGPAWLMPFLAGLAVASAVGAVALSWRLLRRVPYAIPVVTVCTTVLAQVLLPAIACRLVIGGSGEGDFGWKEADEFLLLEARWLLTLTAPIGIAAGLIGLGCRWLWPGE